MWYILALSSENTFFIIFLTYTGDQQQYHVLMNISMVHVDDACSAHIFLLECPDAKGRYICSSDRLTLNEMSEFLSAKYPQLPIPTIEWVLFHFNPFLTIAPCFLASYLLIWKDKNIQLLFCFFVLQFFEGGSRVWNTWRLVKEAIGYWFQV